MGTCCYRFQSATTESREGFTQWYDIIFEYKFKCECLKENVTREGIRIFLSGHSFSFLMCVFNQLQTIKHKISVHYKHL